LAQLIILKAAGDDSSGLTAKDAMIADSNGGSKQVAAKLISMKK